MCTVWGSSADYPAVQPTNKPTTLWRTFALLCACMSQSITQRRPGFAWTVCYRCMIGISILNVAVALACRQRGEQPD